MQIHFEEILQWTAPQQIALVKAIAREPSHSVMSTDYMKRHHLKSIGGVQGALKKLSELDLIEKENGTWKLVDPVFKIWIE